ncbi:MAG: hypothetical protein U1A25_03285 [Candidatus Sungbacteria bacterium]|nr:hypothetical protein [bacterium]MDZ4260667.1 hypothetical protein [Candidatus Sungbacteria bacterium]
MAKPQLLYAAFDTGPSNYGLDVITYAQRKMNWGVVYAGNNSGVGLDLVWNLDFDYAIVGGPSSFENGVDRQILEFCHDHKKPVFVLGNSPRSILRPGVEGRINHATAIVASPSDVELAKAFGYKDAVWLGYPSHWADPAKMKPSTIFMSDAYHRAGLHIFVCGLKEAEITDSMLASVIDAAQYEDATIYFQAHPSEIEKTKNATRRNELLKHSNVIEFTSRENVASLMLACPLTVCTGGATGIIEGALLRLPVVYYMDDQVMAYMKKASNDEIFGPVAAGACEIATADTMASVVHMLLWDPVANAKLRAAQEAAFPHQPEGLNVLEEIFTYIQNPSGYVPYALRS